MGIVDLFSKRQKRQAEAGQPEIYLYDVVPAPLRVQIAQICLDALGEIRPYAERQIAWWKEIHDILARERGVFSLGNLEYASHDRVCVNWMLQAVDVSDVLDFVELSFRYIEKVVAAGPDHALDYLGVRITCDDAVTELNERFQEHKVGYQYESGCIIRVDSHFVHAEIVKPLLLLVSSSEYTKVDKDFRAAHDHFRNKNYKDSIVASGRAFESAMKAICSKHKWPISDGDRAADLIKKLRERHLFPEFLGPGLDTFIAMLKTGLPNVRNSLGAHGELPHTESVSAHFATYALHMTATNIVFLINAERNIR